jgi:hypothetical protein
MATTTPNFGWSVPTSSDLVKNGATAIETLGDSIDASLVDLKGGTTGQFLSKASNTDMDFSWATAGGGGTKIGQVVSTFLPSQFSTSSGSFTDLTGLSLSITPTSATSKIMIFVSITQGTSTGTAGNTFFRLMRDATAIALSTGVTNTSFSAVAGAMLPTSGSGQTGVTFLDSPATTSAITYKVTMRNDGGYTAYINRRGADTDSGGVSTITAMEVVA